MMSPHDPHAGDSLHDPQIDPVLAALNRTAAPAALEERILQRLAKAETLGRWGAFTALRVSWPLATLCAAAVLLAAGLLIRGHRAPDRDVAYAPIPASARMATVEVPPFQPNPLSRSEISRHLDRWPRTGGRSEKTPVLRISAKGIHGHLAGRAVAPEQAGVPDGPAPELPLTEQERLLLRMAQGPPQQIASLKRFVVRFHPDDDGPDFQTFFEPYTTPLIQGDPQ